MEQYPKVLVIMSSYNGELYLEEQLKSILNQKGVKVHILVRDDGSTDKTVSILEKLCRSHTEIEYYAGKNIGVVNSFNDLICHCSAYEYNWIAFSDQDDIWKPEKLINAINKLKEVNNSTAVLYCSNLELVDSHKKHIGMMRKKMPKYTKYSSIVQNCATGCTEVFNQEAARLYRMGIGQYMEMHDYWMFLVAMYLGKFMYDDNAYIQYRQHERNVIGARKKTLITAWNNLVLREVGKREYMITGFLNTYQQLLNKEDIKILSKIIAYKKSFWKKAVLVLSPYYHGYTWKVTMGFKIRVLLNRIY